MSPPPKTAADAALSYLRNQHSNDGPASGSPGPFTSNLSADETVALTRAGYLPQSLVTGVAAQHIGLVRRRWRVNAEVHQLTDAVYAARSNALARMVEAAAQAGSAGVAGVRIEAEFSGRHIARFLAIGTALAIPDEPDGPAPPFSSHLSGQDLYLLARSGYRPVGMVIGCSLYHVGRRPPRSWLSTLRRSTELLSYSDALYAARELAMTRMQEEALSLSATGVVGATVTQASHVWGRRIIEFLAIGTAVVDAAAVPDLHRPQIAVSLDDVDYVSSPWVVAGAATTRSGPESEPPSPARRIRPGESGLPLPWRAGLIAGWLTAFVAVMSSRGLTGEANLALAQLGQGIAWGGGLLAVLLGAAGLRSTPSVSLLAATFGVLASAATIGALDGDGGARVLVFGAMLVVSALSIRDLRWRGRQPRNALRTGPTGSLRRARSRFPTAAAATIAAYLCLLVLMIVASLFLPGSP